MKAKTLTILAVLMLLALMVMPVLALSAVSAPSSDATNTTSPLIIPNRADVTPTINITPLLLSSHQPWGTITTQTLTLSNTGSGDLVWQVVESPAAPAVRTLERPSRPAATEVIQDGGFELGHPNPYWEEYSALYGRVIYSGAGPRTGNWWTWLGGGDYTEAQDSYISQTITITPGLAQLEFWMKMSADGSGNFTVTLDSTIIFTANQTMTSTYASYMLVTRDVTAFADGQAHVLKLAESDPDTPGGFDLNIDDVSLTVIDCVPSNLPWLTVLPSSGTTSVNDSSVINVVFNSAGQVGTQTATLCIVSNDPLQEMIKVPVTLKVPGVYLPLILR